MIIAVAGKGGSGKTTIAGTLARLYARRGSGRVLAIDADSNPNLALTLGLSPERARELKPMNRDVLKRVTDQNGETRSVLAEPAGDVLEKYGAMTADGVRLVLMGRVDHAGAG